MTLAFKKHWSVWGVWSERYVYVLINILYSPVWDTELETWWRRSAPSFLYLSSFPPLFILSSPSLLPLLLPSFPFQPLLSLPLLSWYLFFKILRLYLYAAQHSYTQIHSHSLANTRNNTCHYQCRPAGSFVITLFVYVCCAHIIYLHVFLLVFLTYLSLSTLSHIIFPLSNAHMSNTTPHKATAPVLNRARNSFGFDLESA